MAGMYGADVAELRALAKQLDSAALQLSGARSRIGNGIRIAAWVGPFAVRFRAMWDSDHSRRVHAASLLLQQTANILRANADDQDRTSAVDGSAGSSGTSSSGGAGGKASEGADTSAERFEKAKNVDHDGVRIEAVRGADGKVRLVAYIGGVDSADDFSPFNAIATGTGSVTSATTRVEQAIAAAMKEHPGAQVLLVGYSMGGLIAQQIADRGVIAVTEVQSFASNYYAPTNNYGGANITRLNHNGDPLMNSVLAAAGPGNFLKDSATNLNNLLSNSHGTRGIYEEFRDGNPFQVQSGNGDAAVHGDASDYQWLAERFDHSTDTSANAARDRLNVYGGTVVGTYPSKPTKGH